MGKRYRRRKPLPGIYYDVPFREYVTWPHINNSSLDGAVFSPAHYKASLSEVDDGSDATRLGRLIHSRLLEPEKSESEYVIPPDFVSQLKWRYPGDPKKTAEYYELRDDWFEACRVKGITPITPEQSEIADKVVAEASRPISELLRGALTEVCIVADCPITGLRLKVRFDVLRDDRIVDVKSSRSLLRFRHDMAEYHYDRQMAFYQYVWRLHSGKTLPPWLFVAETNEPFGVALAPVHPNMLGEGLEDVYRALRNCRTYWDDTDNPPSTSPVWWRYTRDRSLDLQLGGDRVTIGRGK